MSIGSHSASLRFLYSFLQWLPMIERKLSFASLWHHCRPMHVSRRIISPSQLCSLGGRFAHALPSENSMIAFEARGRPRCGPCRPCQLFVLQEKKATEIMQALEAEAAKPKDADEDLDMFGDD